MKARTFASVAVMTALGLLGPIQAHAFGLGKIELSSSLNEPFDAQIAVTALRDNDEGQLQVQLASKEEFEKAGIQRTSLLTQFSFEIIEKNGETSIKISSSQPVKEPFIDLLLVATTGNGRLIREYTILLDPPKSVFIEPKVIAQKKASVAKKKTAPQKTSYQYPDPQIPVVTTNYSTASTYDVDRNDTLSSVARKTKPSSDISLNQMMMALLNANPESFTNRNINGLKAGYTLDIPTTSEIQSLTKRQANSAVKEQYAAWKNRNKSVAPVTTVVEQTETTPEKVVVETADTMDMGPSGDDAQLELVAPSDELDSGMDELSPLGDKKLTELSEQLTLAQETIESQAQENIDIQSRMDLMEEQLQTLRKLISLKDADLARLQANLEEEAVTDTPLTTEIEQIESKLDEMQTDATQADNLSDSQSEVEAYFSQIESGDTSSINEDVNDVDELFVEAEMSDSALTDETVTSDMSEKSLLETAGDAVSTMTTKVKAFYTENKQESLIAGLVAALLAFILLLLGRRRQQQTVDWDDAVQQSSAEVVSEAKNEHQNATEVTPITQIPEVTVEELKNDEDSVKPVDEDIESLDAQLEVEELTGDEIETEQVAELNVQDQLEVEELTIDELDMVEAPAALDSEEVSEAVEVEDDIVLEFNSNELSVDSVSEEPEAIAQDNADTDDLLDFNVHGSSTSDDSMDIEESTDSGESTTDETLKSDTSLSFETENKESDDIELSLDDEPLSIDIDLDSELEDISLDDSPVDFDLTLNDETEDEPDLSIDTEASTIDDNDVTEVTALQDVADLSVSDVTAVDTEQADAEQSASDLEFDLGDFDEIDEAETKLDLAGAYMDMEDPEGARNILEEVLIDGNDEQKSRAQKLLNDLS